MSSTTRVAGATATGVASEQQPREFVLVSGPAVFRTGPHQQNIIHQGQGSLQGGPSPSKFVASTRLLRLQNTYLFRGRTCEAGGVEAEAVGEARRIGALYRRTQPRHHRVHLPWGTSAIFTVNVSTSANPPSMCVVRGRGPSSAMCKSSCLSDESLLERNARVLSCAGALG